MAIFLMISLAGLDGSWLLNPTHSTTIGMNVNPISEYSRALMFVLKWF